MDKVGYHSVECWGGATFDAFAFSKEDPRIDYEKIKRALRVRSTDAL